MSKFSLTLLGLLLVVSACGADRTSDNALDAEEGATTASSAEDGSGEGDVGSVDGDDETVPTSVVPPLQPSEPPVTARAGDVAIDVDFGDEQWELTHGELNEVALSVWDSEDFIRRAFGGSVPQGFYGNVAGEFIIGKVLDRQLAELDSEPSDAEVKAGRDALIEQIVSLYGDSDDPVAEAEALFNDVSYLEFVSNLQADQQALLQAITGDGSTVADVPCVRHILLEDDAAAQDALSELEGGADFAELAIERSTGPSAPSGGDLGCASSSNYVPEFAEAVDNADVGQPVGPVETQFGFHVVVVESYEEQPVDPTSELNNRITEDLSGATVEIDPVLGFWDAEALRVVEDASESE